MLSCFPALVGASPMAIATTLTTQNFDTGTQDLIKLDLKITKAEQDNYKFVSCLQCLLGAKNNTNFENQEAIYNELKDVMGISSVDNELLPSVKIESWLKNQVSENYIYTDLGVHFGTSLKEAHEFIQYLSHSLQSGDPMILGNQGEKRSSAALLIGIRENETNPWHSVFYYLNPITGEEETSLARDLNFYGQNKSYVIGLDEPTFKEPTKVVTIDHEGFQVTKTNLDDGLDYLLGTSEENLTFQTSLRDIPRFKSTFEKLSLPNLSLKLSKINGDVAQTDGLDISMDQIPDEVDGDGWRSDFIELGKWTDETVQEVIVTLVRYRISIEITASSELDLVIKFYGSATVSTKSQRLAGRIELETGKVITLIKRS